MKRGFGHTHRHTTQHNTTHSLSSLTSCSEKLQPTVLLLCLCSATGCAFSLPTQMKRYPQCVNVSLSPLSVSLFLFFFLSSVAAGNSRTIQVV